jgi:hypothetical protein
MIVGLLALALSVGTGWQSCAAIQENFASPTASPANPTDLHRNQEHHQHAMMGTDALGNQAVAEAAKGQPESKHACTKCCGVCMLTSVIPACPESTRAQTITHAIFASLIEQLRGQFVVVDPDIPKHIA